MLVNQVGYAMLFSFIKNQNTCSLMYVPLPCSFIIMSMMLQEVKKNLDWSSNHQGSSRPKMSSVGEKKRRWMVLGIRRVHQNKGKRKSKNSKQKKSRNHLSSSSEPFLTSLLFLEVGWKIVVFSLGDGRSGRCFPRSRRPCIGVRA